MRIIDPSISSSTYNKIIQRYGGQYSLLEKLKLGGVGSPKVTYVSGLPTFDAIHYTEDLEHSICNFGLLKAGLMIRINKRQKLGIAIERLDALQSIQLSKEPVHIKGKEYHQGQLSIKFEEQTELTFMVPTAEYPGIEKFFNKPTLKEFLL